MKTTDVRAKFNNKKGFTLAEVLVVLGLMTILLSLSIVGVASYSKDLKLMEMDSTARQIFIAAQNHLTEMEASGALKAYGNTPADGSCSPGEPMTDKPKDFGDSEEWPTGGSNENHKFYYVVYNPNVSGAEALENTILKGMLPFGSIDEEIRTGGSYIIEYDLETANVYGVFYTDKDNITLIYQQDVKDIDFLGGRSDSADGKKVRKNQMQGENNFVLGYYGGAMAKNLVAVGLTEPTLKVVNEDTLTVEITDSNYFKTTSAYGSNSIKYETDLVMTVKGLESGSEKKFNLTVDNSSGIPKQDTSVAAGEKALWTVKIVDDGANKALKYVFTLDDITEAKMHFADIFSGFIPGENITITAQCSSTHVLSNVTEASAMTNSLFASAALDNTDVTGQTKNVNVEYIRHLENLHSEVSGLPMNPININNGLKTIGIVKNVTQVKNMDWNTDNWKDATIYGYAAGGTAKSLAENSFYGIENRNLKSYDGNGYELKNFVIKDTDNSAGLFSIVKAAEPLKISNLELHNFNVEGHYNAGGLIGDIDNSSKAVEINRVMIAESNIIAKGINGGGLVGFCRAKDSKITKSFAAATTVEAQASGQAAGGLVGEVNGENVEIADSYTGGMTVKGKYSTDTDLYNVTAATDTGAAAGGLIGRVSDEGITVNNCYSTCSVYSGNAGGLVGVDNISGSKYKDCYAVGLVDTTGSGKAGSFSSVVKGTLDDCYYLKGINGEKTGLSGSDGSSKGLTKEKLIELAVKHTGDETHAYDDTIKEKYPYKMVNNTGADSKTAPYAHFGDWQEPAEETQEVEASYTFAYRETVGGVEGWYVIGKQRLTDGSIVDTTLNTLQKDKDVKVDEGSTSYGFLVAAGDKVENKQFQGAPQNFIDNDNLKTNVIINSNKYDYYPVNISSIKDVNQNNGIYTLPKWKNVGNDLLSLYFNPDFAAAVSMDKDKLGTADVPYQIRTQEQKTNVNRLPAYNDKVFKYTGSINE